MKIADTSVPVVVLSLSRAPLLHGAVGIARSLGRLGIPVHLVHDDRRMPADLSRYVRKSYTVGFNDTTSERLLDELVRIGRRIGGRPILVPIDDIGALFLVDHTQVFQKWFRFPELAPDLAHALASKRELYLLCKSAGIATPESVFPESREDVAAFADETRFPVVVKEIDPLLLHQRPEARSVVIARSRQDLFDVYDRVEVDDKPNLMLQEYIPGDAQSIWMFNGYCDVDSQCLMGLTGIKLRQCLPHTGPTSLGLCLSNPAVEQTTRRFLERIGYRGIVDLGYRYDARDGQYKLLDVNPRIGGTFRLFVAPNGMDVARALYLDLTGQPVPPSTTPDGRKWVVEQYDLLASRLYHREGELSLGQWVRSFRGVQEAAWFAMDDAAPFAAMCWRSLRLAVRRRARPRPASRTQRPLQGGRNSRAQQELLNGYFASRAQFWQDVYQGRDVFSIIHQHRQALALEWISGLGLPTGSHMLEVGCGAGFTTASLLRDGFAVTAVDMEPRMLAQARTRARGAELGSRLTTSLADVHTLPFADAAFDLVVALGVVPWLHTPERGMREMVRVLRPGGYMVVNADNRSRLTHLLDPLHNPTLQPLRQAAKAALVAARLHRSGRPKVSTVKHSRDEFDQMVAESGLELVGASAFGFGPFTMLGREVLPQRLGVAVNARLQAMADRGVRLFGSTGAQYLVLARKPVASPGSGGG
jgi:D-aspartate ligase